MNTRNGIFRGLTAAEQRPFRQWARENYQPFSEIKSFWHPVVQAECVAINAEAGRTTVVIEERGNGFPACGDYVPGDDGNLYRVISLEGSIQTGHAAGCSNWVRARVEPADWNDCAEEDEHACMTVISDV